MMIINENKKKDRQEKQQQRWRNKSANNKINNKARLFSLPFWGPFLPTRPILFYLWESPSSFLLSISILSRNFSNSTQRTLSKTIQNDLDPTTFPAKKAMDFPPKTIDFPPKKGKK